jgi:hypothetical protein
MDDEILPEDAAEIEDEAESLRKAQRQIQELEQRGWIWRGDGIDKVLSLHDDPDVNIWFNPYSGEQLLSPKLVERLEQQIRDEKAHKGKSSRCRQ